MKILLLPLGEIDKEAIAVLKDRIKKAFGRGVTVAKALPAPDFALNKKRGQHNSTLIINHIMDVLGLSAYERILGVTERDLYASGLNFVFGEAGSKAAVISLARLREGFYGSPENKGLFYRRAETEAVHELGHTYGLEHCKDAECVMFFSNSIKDTDRKGPGLCRDCAERLRKVAF